VQSSRLQSAVADLTAASDVLLVDTATGISDNVVSWLQAANEVLVVTSPDPAAIVDAYAVLKLLAGLDSRRRLLLLVNNVRDEQEASAVHQRLESAVCEFLHTNLVAFGHVLRDPLLQEAVRRRQPIVTFLPDSPSSACFTRLARRLLAEAPGTTRIAPRTEPAELVTATK
jgi:flagellar biosynthesis protein FlhG